MKKNKLERGQKKTPFLTTELCQQVKEKFRYVGCLIERPCKVVGDRKNGCLPSSLKLSDPSTVYSLAWPSQPYVHSLGICIIRTVVLTSAVASD